MCGKYRRPCHHLCQLMIKGRFSQGTNRPRYIKETTIYCLQFLKSIHSLTQSSGLLPKSWHQNCSGKSHQQRPTLKASGCLSVPMTFWHLQLSSTGFHITHFSSFLFCLSSHNLQSGFQAIVLQPASFSIYICFTPAQASLQSCILKFNNYPTAPCQPAISRIGAFFCISISPNDPLPI